MNHRKFIIITLSLFFSYTGYSQLNNDIQQRIQTLKSKGIDTFVCYYEDCYSDLWFPTYDTNCIITERKYLFWIKNGVYFRQNFDNCLTSKVFSFDISPFLDLFRSKLDSIKYAEIKPVISRNTKKKGNKKIVVETTSTVDHTCVCNFDIYINNQIINKSINKFELETDSLFDGSININYKANQKSILKRLKDALIKEL